MKFLYSILAIFALLFVAVQAGDNPICLQPKETGPCRGAEKAFHYDSASNSCEQFFYGGCRGNDNRFDSKEKCEETCKN